MRPILHYDALAVGDRFERTYRVGGDAILRFMALTGTGGAVAEGSVPRVPGAFLIALASRVLGSDFPGPGTVVVSLRARFIRPVEAGGRVRMEVRVIEKIERFRHLKLRLWAYTADGMVGRVDVVAVPPEADAVLPDPAARPSEAPP